MRGLVAILALAGSSGAQRERRRDSSISEVLLPRRRKKIVELAELRNGNGHIPGFSIVEGLRSALAVQKDGSPVGLL